MNNERISIKNKVFELNESNDIYMTLNFPILSNDVNYNNLQFTDDFINGIVKNKDKYIGIPLVVNREKLESGEFDDLGHELKDGQLLTDQVGSHVDFWSEEVDGALCLMSSIRVMKRFPSVCEAIVELYNSGDLESSCEVLVSDYLEITEDKVRKVHYNNGKNIYIGSAIVSEPAEHRSRATLLVAEAYKKDIEKKGDINLAEVFNKGNKTKFHIEKSEMSHEDIRQQIYNAINPINPETEERKYRYWIREVFETYFIIEEWDNSDKLYKVEYSLNGDTVNLTSEFQPVEMIYQVVGTDVFGNLNELQKELNKTKEELSKMDTANEEKVVELQSKVEELESKITELNATIVEQQEAKSTLESQVTELNSNIEELSKYKEQVETAEKESKVKELNEKYSKLLPEDVMKAETTQSLINELKVTELNELVVNEVAKQKQDIEVNEKGDSDVTISSKTPEDLLPNDVKTKYGLSI